MSIWNQLANEMVGPGSNDSKFGHNVAISGDGNRIAIGAPEDDITIINTAIRAGSVRIYDYTFETGWVLTHSITGAEPDEQLGSSIALSEYGTILVVGFSDSINQVRMYRDGIGGWDLDQIIFGPNQIIGNAQFGHSVSINSAGDRILIGAPGVINTTTFTTPGAAYLYDYDGNNWNMGITFEGTVNGGEFGSVVSISGDGTTLAIGAPNVDGVGSERGEVTVFEFETGMMMWISNSIISGDINSERLGTAISLSDDGMRLVLGSPLYDTNLSNNGRVTIYEKGISGYSPMNNGVFDGASASDNLGDSAAISRDGNTVVAGAPGDSSVPGYVSTYGWSGTMWELKGTSLNGDIMADRFGDSVTLTSNGQRLGVGISGGGTAGNLGAARVYRDLTSPSIMPETTTPPSGMPPPPTETTISPTTSPPTTLPPTTQPPITTMMDGRTDDEVRAILMYWEDVIHD